MKIEGMSDGKDNVAYLLVSYPGHTGCDPDYPYIPTRHWFWAAQPTDQAVAYPQRCRLYVMVSIIWTLKFCHRPAA